MEMRGIPGDRKKRKKRVFAKRAGIKPEQTPLRTAMRRRTHRDLHNVLLRRSARCRSSDEAQGVNSDKAKASQSPHVEDAVDIAMPCAASKEDVVEIATPACVYLGHLP